MLTDKPLCVLGAGKMVEAILAGLHRAGVAPAALRGTRRAPEQAEETAGRLGVAIGTDNRAAADGAGVVILAVKPRGMAAVLKEIAPVLTPGQLVISIAASVKTADIEAHIAAGIPVIRAMPNTPCLIGKGMTVVSRGAHATAAHLDKAKAIFAAIGEVAALDEYLMDAVTGLSGSGPAYIYVIIESLAEAGVKLGIPRHVATLLAAQTCLGAASMTLELGEHPALLKDSVTTPAGCTVDGLMELEEGKLRVTLIKAVVKAAERAGQLG
jgi:pyrroline-5-carboxylate reductase